MNELPLDAAAASYRPLPAVGGGAGDREPPVEGNARSRRDERAGGSPGLYIARAGLVTAQWNRAVVSHVSDCARVPSGTRTRMVNYESVAKDFYLL